MARTVLHRRSRESLTAVQLADRTGIVAASTPPAAAQAADARQPDKLSMLVAAAGTHVSSTRRVRRSLAVSSAAALFLVVGWIGGRVWGHQDEIPAPAAAIGSVPSEEQDGIDPAPPPPQVTEAPEREAPPVTPPAKRVTASAKPRVTSTKTTARTPAPVSVTQDPVDTVAQDWARLVSAWAWAYPALHGNNHNGR